MPLNTFHTASVWRHSFTFLPEVSRYTLVSPVAPPLVVSCDEHWWEGREQKLPQLSCLWRSVCLSHWGCRAVSLPFLGQLWPWSSAAALFTALSIIQMDPSGSACQRKCHFGWDFKAFLPPNSLNTVNRQWFLVRYLFLLNILALTPGGFHYFSNGSLKSKYRG